MYTQQTLKQHVTNNVGKHTSFDDVRPTEMFRQPSLRGIQGPSDAQHAAASVFEVIACKTHARSARTYHAHIPTTALGCFLAGEIAEGPRDLIRDCVARDPSCLDFSSYRD